MTTNVHEPIDDAGIEHRLRTMYRTVMPLLETECHASLAVTAVPTPATAAFELADDAAEIDLFDVRPRQPRGRSRSRLTVAAVSVAVVGVVAGAVGLSQQMEPRPSAPDGVAIPGEGAADPVAMILDPLPDGIEHTATDPEVHVREEPSSVVVQLYGSVADPGDPSRMIRIEYAASPYLSASCDVASREPFLIGDQIAATCMQGTVTTIMWTIDVAGISVSAYLGRGVTLDEAEPVLDALIAGPAPAPSSPPIDGQAQGPPTHLVARELPEGWVPLLYDDVPYSQRITEANWVATVGGNDSSPSQLVVSTWTGLDDEQAIFARQQPIEAERISVRGHDAYLYVSKQRGDQGPLQIDVWWVERPGMVVLVDAVNLYEPDELIAILDHLQPVDVEGYQSFK